MLACAAAVLPRFVTNPGTRHGRPGLHGCSFLPRCERPEPRYLPSHHSSAGRPHQRGDRRRAVHGAAHRRSPPVPGVPQAQRAVPERAMPDAHTTRFTAFPLTSPRAKTCGVPRIRLAPFAHTVVLVNPPGQPSQAGRHLAEPYLPAPTSEALASLRSATTAPQRAPRRELPPALSRHGSAILCRAILQ